MTQLQALTTQKIQNYQDQIQNAGTLAQQKAAAIAVYQDLYAKGYNYAGWSLGNGEPQGISTHIQSADCGFFIRGNGRVVAEAQAALAAPTVNAPSTRPQTLTITPAANPGMPTLPAAPSYGGVPASNYRTLRDTDNVYYPSGGGYIVFSASMVKINNGTRNTLIGTDGADSFDASYYAAYSQYFNSSLLVNFMGGGGNDEMGGSVRNDKQLVQAGNDACWMQVA